MVLGVGQPCGFLNVTPEGKKQHYMEQFDFIIWNQTMHCKTRRAKRLLMRINNTSDLMGYFS